ncbi:hypothetical protein PINS_up022545 [Pythium insidiosum]|nr:hypothetical protein PINS_up022545 [Pythium insidiosum]
MAVAVLVLLTLGPLIVRGLWRAYRSSSIPSTDRQFTHLHSARAPAGRVFRTTMVRLLVVSVYGVAAFTISVLTSLGMIAVSTSEHANESSYYRSTIYAYCLTRTCMLGSMGFFLSVLVVLKKRRLRVIASLIERSCCCCWRCCCRRRRHAQTAAARVLSPRSRSELDRVLPSDFAWTAARSAKSPRSPPRRVLFPSAADSAGQTVVSIPPEPQHQRAHFVATQVMNERATRARHLHVGMAADLTESLRQAYTVYVLQSAREELMLPDDDRSSVASSSFDTSSSYDFDSDSGSDRSSGGDASTPEWRPSGAADVRPSRRSSCGSVVVGGSATRRRQSSIQSNVTHL